MAQSLFRLNRYEHPFWSYTSRDATLPQAQMFRLSELKFHVSARERRHRRLGVLRHQTPLFAHRQQHGIRRLATPLTLVRRALSSRGEAGTAHRLTRHFFRFTVAPDGFVGPFGTAVTESLAKRAVGDAWTRLGIARTDALARMILFTHGVAGFEHFQTTGDRWILSRRLFGGSLAFLAILRVELVFLIVLFFVHDVRAVAHQLQTVHLHADFGARATRAEKQRRVAR